MSLSHKYDERPPGSGGRSSGGFLFQLVIAVQQMVQTTTDG